MSINRIHVSSEIESRLRLLKARTGIETNYLCRLGFCLSLNEPGTPDPHLYADGGDKEFNRYTLTGVWDVLFFSLLRQRLLEDHIDIDEHLDSQFKAHFCRGIVLLFQRVRSLEDLTTLIISLNPSVVHNEQTNESPFLVDKLD